MAQKPSIPKGTRDFSTDQTARRSYIFDTISQVFRLYGFRPIETPALENLSTLMGKYGEEGDRLLFKVLNSGDFLSDVDQELLSQGASPRLAAKLCDKGLRYDLTVPFARFVVQHRSELSMPFKRYQIQPVWRADRPQRGRYREFYQCDADIVGSTSLLNEVELITMVDEVFARFGIRVALKLNNRKILAGIAELIGAPELLVDITVAIDKIDKIGLDAVCAELIERGLKANQIDAIKPLLNLDGSFDERLSKLAEILSPSAIGLAGVEELATIARHLKAIGDGNKPGLRCVLELDPSLARGLNYYTGTIMEVKAVDTPMGSIAGGGRYDNLTGVFGVDGLSGVGVSFGADRIYDVLTALDLFPKNVGRPSTIIFANLGEAEADTSLKAAAALRREGISAEVYPDSSKLKKQLAYADSLGIPLVGIIGSDELAEGTISIKNLATGEQTRIALIDLPQFINNIISAR